MPDQNLGPNGIPLPSAPAPSEQPSDELEQDSEPLPRWALVKSRSVFTVVQQATEPNVPGYESVPVLAGQLVNPGDDFDGEVFTPTAVPQLRHVTRLAFLQRFLDSEAIAIDLASIGATVQAASVRLYLQLVNAAAYIDLDRPDTRAGVVALETAGLLQDGRALEILDTPLSDGEHAGGAR